MISRIQGNQARLEPAIVFTLHEQHRLKKIKGLQLGKGWLTSVT